MTAPLILPGDIIAFKNQEFSVVSIAVSLFEDCVLIIVNDGGKLLELKTDQVTLLSRQLFRGK